MSTGSRTPRKGEIRPDSREDRLKAALKANLARRKAQAKARNATEAEANGPDGQEKKE